jgi:hypothetical protein
MNAKTIRVDVRVVDTQGCTSMEGQLTADTILRDNPMEISGVDYRVIDLRLLVRRELSEDLIRAIRTGQVELAIDSVPTLVERMAA